MVSSFGHLRTLARTAVAHLCGPSSARPRCSPRCAQRCPAPCPRRRASAARRAPRPQQAGRRPRQRWRRARRARRRYGCLLAGPAGCRAGAAELPLVRPHLARRCPQAVQRSSFRYAALYAAGGSSEPRSPPAHSRLTLPPSSCSSGRRGPTDGCAPVQQRARAQGLFKGRADRRSCAGAAVCTTPSLGPAGLAAGIAPFSCLN